MLFVSTNNPLPIMLFIFRCHINNEFYLVFRLCKNIISIRFSLDKLDSMSNQFHQIVVIRKLSLTVCNISDKWRILLNVPSNIYGSFYVPIVISMTDIPWIPVIPH